MWWICMHSMFDKNHLEILPEYHPPPLSCPFTSPNFATFCSPIPGLNIMLEFKWPFDLLCFFYSLFRYAPDKVGRTDMNQENRFRLSAESLLFSSANNLMNSWLKEAMMWVLVKLSFFCVLTLSNLELWCNNWTFHNSWYELTSVQAMSISGKLLTDQPLCVKWHTCTMGYQTYPKQIFNSKSPSFDYHTSKVT
jgi:hypothetical protein